MTEQLSALDVAALTDVGLKRKRNEDFCEYYIPAPHSPQHKHGALFVVADGMGGMGGGDVASQAAVKTLFDHYYTGDLLPNRTPQQVFKQALDAANAAVREKAREINLPRIGSTASGVLLIPGGEALIFNVGDARVYRIRQNFIEQLSHDQSVLQHQLDAGVITEEQARQARNVNVTAFIGQQHPLEAVYHNVEVHPDDIFLMCSDGLWDLVEPHEMLTIVQQYSAEVACRRLIELAHKRGAHDNVTAIVLRIGDKPRQAFAWKPVAAAILVLVLIAAGIWWAFLRDDDSQEASGEANTANLITPTSAAAANSEDASATTAATLTDAAGSAASPPTAAPTTSSGVIIYTTTPSHTPPATATLDVTATPTATRTLIPSATATATTTPTSTVSATATAQPSNTPPPSDTPTRTPPPSPTASRTPRPSRTPTITSTPVPSATTTPKPPTATLNPDVISPTPSPLPSPTPTFSPAEMMLIFAAADGVTLHDPAALVVLYQFDGSDEITVLQEITLEPDTQVRVISDTVQPHPEQADLLLREVEILNTVNSQLTGWIDVTRLEAAQPIAAYAVAHEIGANLRRGDSTAYAITGALSPGEIAQITGRSTRAPGWYRVETQSGFTGWVSSAAADILGAADAVPAVAAPALPTAAPTTPAPDDPGSEPN